MEHLQYSLIRIDLADTQNFGTRGSEVQILSPRPIQNKATYAGFLPATNPKPRGQFSARISALFFAAFSFIRIRYVRMAFACSPRHKQNFAAACVRRIRAEPSLLVAPNRLTPDSTKNDVKQANGAQIERGFRLHALKVSRQCPTCNSQ